MTLFLNITLPAISPPTKLKRIKLYSGCNSYIIHIPYAAVLMAMALQLARAHLHYYNATHTAVS